MFELSDHKPFPVVSDTLKDFLAHKKASAPLGRPVQEVVAQGMTVPVPPGVKEEHVEEAIALARKLQNMSMRDKGILAQLASQFTREYFKEFGQGATGLLLEVAIDAYVELMCQIGSIHVVGQSEVMTARKLTHQAPAFARMFLAIEQRIGSLMAQLVNDQLGEELVRLDGLLNDERELMSGAAERAQADATAERRRADALQAQLEQAKAQAAAREAELERILASERAATIRREREWNEARRRLEDDKAAAQRVAAQLNAELQQRDEAQGLTGVQESVTLASALEAMSLRRFLIDQGLEASVQRAVVTCPSGISAAAVEAWRGLFPDAAAQRAQLRAAVAQAAA
ncbi:hypothetical protein [Deinococcus xianganensis]|uniref:Uncharacterized protein n=1 Tax=Deinococcus xianganensis TaxID=1507289 RepID=A0A6I4YJR4_9DEIO|nr:hypothetical protein [Deinococcus xianganensis]MXV20800.1 hypothetical protein [Deinococcus xianganensis]